ncbi:GerW family sporulation protein [Clostridium sp. 19966]|uniref:GerW family sporulation protein n=1 Tax=Clostridium sp. 19966 TaxID=2768166 RepID=UPI0028E02FDA|nr:GerW family sporulation protein [Clostridium sp. 19966]MDT8716563.1 GerW family sporulation protein [Clostridium sp. 19966]
MVNNHPIEGLMGCTMENIRDMIDVNTIIGDPIESKDGSFILPISKVSFGFASGGSEFSNKVDNETKYPFGGASGAGVSLRPVAFIVINGDNVKLLSVEHDNPCDRLIDYIPQIIDMIKGAKSRNDSCEKNQ